MLQCMKTEASNYAYSAPWKLPAKDYRRFIEDLAAMIPDPVKKLKFLNQVMGSYQKMPFYSKLCPPVAEAAARKIIIEKAKQYCPECLADNHEFIQKYGAEPRLSHVWSSLRQYNIFKSSGLLLFIWCIGLLVTSFAAILHSDYSSDMKTAYTEKGVFHSIIYPSGIPQGKTEGTGIANHSDHQNNPEQLHAYATEKTPDHNKIVTLPEPIAGMYFAYVHDMPHGRYQRFNVYSAYIPDDGVQLPAEFIAGESTGNKESVNEPATIQANVKDKKPEKQNNNIASQSLPASDTVQKKEIIPQKHFPIFIKNPIWLVEKTKEREIYSNRLQIITTHTVKNIPREYYEFFRNYSGLPMEDKTSSQIRGLLFHASESDILDFKPEMNQSIVKFSRLLIKYLCKKKSYHYFIDRFGRVYRLIYDDQAAFHAGNSIWADDDLIYLNLNHSFIGICFEGRDFVKTTPSNKEKTSDKRLPKIKPMGNSSITEVQLRSGKELTDWLRYKYRIAQYNCAPHCLASVNPKHLLIGYHLDLSRGFPFEEFGLSNKYKEPLPAITEFGFKHDNYFLKIFNGNPWAAVKISEEFLQNQAIDNNLKFHTHRKNLNKKFTRLFEWKKSHQKNKS